MKLRKWRSACLPVLLAVPQTILARAATPDRTAVFEHDARVSVSAPLPSNEGWNDYPSSSGIVFLSDRTVAEYVLTSQENHFIQRHEKQAADGYTLTITIFDLEQKKAIAKNDIGVPGKFVRLYRSRKGNLVLCTQAWVALLSEDIQIVNRVKLAERFGNVDVSFAVDINQAHLYLIGEAADECPNLVEVLDSDSLTTQDWWCLKEKAQNAFYGNIAIQYHERRDSVLQIYRNGSLNATVRPPGLIVAAQAIPLPGNLLLISNGGSLLGYDPGKGEEFLASVAQNWNIVSPIECDLAGDNCAMALAIPKGDTFDAARKTTYKDVAIALVNSRDGKVGFQQSIRNLFINPTRIGLSDLSDIRVAVAPHGQYVSVWHACAWEVYIAQ